MQIIPYIVAYAAIAIFIIAVIVRFRMWSGMPMHVRWELYPVAHEAKRYHYGGSYLEESEWWKKPREVSMMAELKVMIPEIVFLVALKEHNPKLWIRSFPFHFGLYMVIGATFLMMGQGLAGALIPSISACECGFGVLLNYVILFLGASGLMLSILGALGLLQRRLTSSELKDYTSGADIFNLLIFVLAFGCAFLTFVLVDNDFSIITAFVTNLVTFNMMPIAGQGLELILPTASVILMGLLVVYIPLTHMSHFVGKYFAYHSIRWNDTPNLAGGPEEEAIHAVLGQKISWNADHIKGEGKKTWLDVATEEFKK